MQVRLFKPSVGEEELKNIRDVFERSWLGLGPLVTEFEQKWSEYLGVDTSIAVNSGTAALQLAIEAFNFPPGSKVLVPALTFVSTASSILHNNLEPVFVDIDERTLGMSLDDLEKKYTKDCVAVLPVHMAGHPVPMDELNHFAKENNLRVVEDCAHCTGGSYKGRKLGAWGDAGCFSFEEKKGMTTGDGGMISSCNTELLEPLRANRWVGIDKDTWKRTHKYTDSKDIDSMHWYYEISVLGYKYNMNDLMAAIGLAQLEKLDGFNEKRRHIIKRYLNGIKDCETITPLLDYNLTDNAYWLFGVRCEKRDELIMFLKKRGIATSVHYMPLTMHPLFSKYHTDFPVLDRVWPKMVTLPLFPDLSNEEIDYVVEAVISFDNQF